MRSVPPRREQREPSMHAIGLGSRQVHEAGAAAEFLEPLQGRGGCGSQRCAAFEHRLRMSLHPLLHPLRCTLLRRWVLACVLLAWGGAWAAPLLQPAGWHVVCAASGHVKLVAASADDDPASSTGHCPLCTPPALATADAAALPDPIAVGAAAPAARAEFHPSANTDALPPARGPPTH